MSKKVVRILRLLIELRYKYLFQFSIVIVERGSKLEVGENTKIIKSKIVVKNRHNLQIGNSCIIKKCTLSFYSDNGWRESSIGSNGNFNGVYLQAYGSFKCGDWNIFEQKSNTPMLTVFNGSLDIGHHNRFMNRFWIRYNANVRIGNYNNINERSWLRADEQITKLKYTRRECKMVALWLNNLAMTPEKSCEMMHSKREMWVRMIRALRLAEYARKPGFENLKELMDVFYCQAYTVWQGEVERSRLKADAAQTFALLKQRPGMFARSLFANMLWFGPEETLAAFKEVVHLLPARLVVTLGMYAESYFEQGHKRMVKPLGGNALLIEPHYLVSLYMEDQLKEMVKEVQDLCKEVVATRFANAGAGSGSASMYIDPMLFHIPLSIGDRSEAVQDTSCALQGTRFPVEGDKVRLFMQWGKGLPAQHLDMDLSCHITLPSTTEVCSYFNLKAIGAKHSGDIRSIPDKKGTAEYIELDLNELDRVGAQYVAFTCNAYSNGAISPNLVVGWMNSAYPMKISERNGVAYDPSCVQHQVRVSQSVQKGLVFGVLKVKEREVVWLEIPFGGQTVLSLDTQTIEKYLDKLEAKTTVGELLAIKAQAQGLKLADTPEADEVYTREWALNTAAVTKLLLGD